MTNTLTEQIEKEREEARVVCDTKGANSPECAAAYDAIEEMQAEVSHQKETPPKSSFEKFCEDNPDDAQCRIHDN